ncbi:MAG: MBL fold metallo-hydrolase [Planctomycetota bacterium]
MVRHRIATAVLVTRASDAAVLCVLRAPELRFFGGYWAFPGGVLDPGDWAEAAEGAPEDGEREARALLCCGLRELFEETGILPEALAGALDTAARDALRAALLASEDGAARRFRALVDAAPAVADEVSDLGTLTTPAFAPVRYRTRFCTSRSRGSNAEIAPRAAQRELVACRVESPARWLADWRSGAELIAPPVLFLLGELQRAGLAAFVRDIGAEFAALEAGRMHTIRNVPGIVMAPLATVTLPPATTTNAYVVGEERLFVVDPAPVDPRELLRLEDMLDARVAAGSRVAAVLLTHHHPDHVGGAAAIARRYDVPVCSHPETLARLDLGATPTQALEDGALLELGAAPDGAAGWTLRALHTPGHAPGHLCFLDSRYRALIAGDLVSTVSTIVIDPADGGHLATYLASLQRVLDLGIGVLHPAHGPVASDGRAALVRYIEHRALRERALVSALSAEGASAPLGARDVEALTRAVYADVEDPRLLPIAARSLRAGLIKLAEEGRARETAAGWVRVE